MHLYMYGNSSTITVNMAAGEKADYYSYGKHKNILRAIQI